MLSERRQRVLRALIEDYIEYALPVGSRTLTERHRLGVSPATVRNDLSALEDAGFIQQPHTSAGRVPTDAGYRTFVDELLSSGLAEEERPHQAMVDELRASASELDALMERTSAALARLKDFGLHINADFEIVPHSFAHPFKHLHQLFFRFAGGEVTKASHTDFAGLIAVFFHLGH